MCGLIGIVNHDKDAVRDAQKGLGALEHRGGESTGIVTCKQGKFYFEGGIGDLSQAFACKDISNLKGRIAIGHSRYSTAGRRGRENIQPLRSFFGGSGGREFYLAHNGNIVNIKKLKKEFSVPNRLSDTHVIVEMISKSGKTHFEDALIDAAEKLQGSFNLVALFNENIYALKDRFGFHPLQLGIRNETDIIIASESCAFDLLGGLFIKDIEPGEMIMVERSGNYASHYWHKGGELKLDLMEAIYFCRPDSVIHGVEIGLAREEMGFAASMRFPIQADIVASVPASGDQAALGYYKGIKDRSFGVNFEPTLLIRPHSAERTFTRSVLNREECLKFKFNARPAILAGRDVIIVDDSLVRASTAKRIVNILTDARARKINLVITSPMYLYPDYLGMDTYRIREEIIARKLDGDKRAIVNEINSGGGRLESLNYIELDDTIDAVLRAKERTAMIFPEFKALKLGRENFYTGHFTGIYPGGVGDFA